MVTLIIIGRLVHILGGITWVGAVITSVFFIEPSADALGRPGHRFLAHLILRRRLTNVMAVAATATLVAGAYLYWTDSNGLQGAWMTTRMGIAFAAGGVAALAAFVLAAVFLKPGFDRLAVLGDGVGDAGADREAERIGRRLRPISLIQVALLLFAAGAMATARYLP